MSKKSKLNVATAIAVLTTAIAVLGLSSQAFTVGGGLGLNGEFGGVRAASGFHSSTFVSAPRPSSTHQRRSSIHRSRTLYHNRPRLQSRRRVQDRYLATAETGESDV
jgi:hypothetical protein